MRDLDNVLYAGSCAQCLNLRPPSIAADGADNCAFRPLNDVCLIATLLDSFDDVADLFCRCERRHVNYHDLCSSLWVLPLWVDEYGTGSGSDRVKALTVLSRAFG